MKNRWFSRPQGQRRIISHLAGWVLVAALSGTGSPASAGVPDWLSAAARETLPAYPEESNAVVLLDEQSTTVKGSGDIETQYRRAFKILRPGGRAHGMVGVYFDSETRLTSLKAWSITAQGIEYEVKEKDALETSPFEGQLFQDTRFRVLKIPASEPGNVVGYEYVQKRRPMVLQDRWWFQDEIPVRVARYVLRLPEGWEFRTVWLNHAELKPQTQGSNDWTWELRDVPAIDLEPSMPPWQGVAGRLALNFFSPRSDISGKSHGSWEAVAAWYSGLTTGRRQASPEIKQKVVELTANAENSLEKIAALAAFVQREIRYVAIEIGIGGYQPHPAADVFANRYGDCKDKVTLLSTMLREIGIESYYLLVHATRGVVARDFPSMTNFNHVILAIKLPDDVSTISLYSLYQHQQMGSLLLFDPTQTMVPLGYLPPSLEANYGLLVREGGGEILQLPMSSPNVNRLLRNAKLELAPTGALSGDVTEIRWGVPALNTRAQLLDVPAEQRNKALEDFLGLFVGSLVFQGAQVENLEDTHKTLVLRYRFTAKDYAKRAGDLLLVRPRVLGRKSVDLVESKGRKQPVEFPSASLETDIYEISLPPGYSVDELPLPASEDSAFAEYHSKVEVAGNVLKYSRNYTVKQITVPTSRLDELKNFFRHVAADERNSAVLKRTTP